MTVCKLCGKNLIETKCITCNGEICIKCFKPCVVCGGKICKTCQGGKSINHVRCLPHSAYPYHS